MADDRLDWVAEIGGVRRRWQARILEQVPDRKVAWAATQGTTNAGAVTFEELDGGQTSVTLVLDYEPEGLVEGAGDALHLVERQVEADLERFKELIESEGEGEASSGGWATKTGAGWTSPADTPGVGAVRMLSDEEIEQLAVTSPENATPAPRTTG